MTEWKCRVICEFPVAGHRDRVFETEIDPPPFGVSTGDWLVNLPDTEMFSLTESVAPWELCEVTGKVVDLKNKTVDIEFSFVKPPCDDWSSEIAVMEMSTHWNERIGGRP